MLLSREATKLLTSLGGPSSCPKLTTVYELSDREHPVTHESYQQIAPSFCIIARPPRYKQQSERSLLPIIETLLAELLAGELEGLLSSTAFCFPLFPLENGVRGECIEFMVCEDGEDV